MPANSRWDLIRGLKGESVNQFVQTRSVWKLSYELHNRWTVVRLGQVIELTAVRKSPEELWSPTACSSVGIGHFFQVEQAATAWSYHTPLLLPGLKMSGAVPTLPRMPSCLPIDHIYFPFIPEHEWRDVTLQQVAILSSPSHMNSDKHVSNSHWT